MSFRTFPPRPELAPWVAGYDILESSPGAAPQTVLPDLQPVMGFQYRGRVISLGNGKDTLLDLCGITGLLGEARVYRYLPGTGTVLVRFHPWGASAFLPGPMEEVADRSVGLAALLAPGQVREVGEKLEASRNDGERIQAVEGFLLSLLRSRTPDGMIRRAVRLLRADPAGMPVKAMADTLGVSDRQLERKFKEWIGIGPKRFARLARFRSAVNALNASSLPSKVGQAGAGQAGLGHSGMGQTGSGRVVVPDGYFDQAHFIKDFRAFAGTTPSSFLKSAADRAAVPPSLS